MSSPIGKISFTTEIELESANLHYWTYLRAGHKPASEYILQPICLKACHIRELRFTFTDKLIL